MPAKQTEQSKRAVKLVDGGTPIYRAAILCGIYPSTIYKFLKSRAKTRAQKKIDKRNGKGL